MLTRIASASPPRLFQPFLSTIILSLFTRGRTVGGEPKPIYHRFEPRFGMENVPKGWSPRNAYTRAKCFSLLSSRHCLLAGIRWAGGQSPSATLPNRSSARTTSSRDDVRGKPTHEHRMRCTTGGRGARAHRPPPRTKFGTEHVTKGEEDRRVPPALTSKNH